MANQKNKKKKKNLKAQKIRNKNHEQQTKTGVTN